MSPQTSPVFPHPSPTTSTHYCKKRHDSCGLWAFIRAWWLIPIHFIYTILFTLSLLYLDGGLFPVSSTSHIKPSQINISTIVSAGLVGVRLLTSTWQSLAAWRCVFILLSKTGLRLSQLCNLISWKWPVFSGRKYIIWTFFILVLTWPAQLAAPLASGSIKWIPTLELLSQEASNVSILSAQTTEYNQIWEYVQRFENERANHVDFLAGITSSISLAGANNAGLSRRMISNTRVFPNGSSVGTVTVPFFKFETFDWVEDPTELPDDIQEAVVNDQSGYLNFSSSISALSQIVGGDAAMLKTTAFIPDASGWGFFPNATRYINAQKYIAVYVARYENYGDEVVACASNVTSWINVPDMTYLATNDWNNETNCYAIALTTISAGVATCQATIISPMVVQCNSEPSIPSADPLIDLIFDMLPDVMEKVAGLDAMHLSISSDVDTYTKNIVLQSYQGIWSALSENFADANEATINPVHVPLEAVRAKVSRTRMYIWAALNFLLTLSGILLGLLESKCEVKTVVNPVLSAIMLDASPVIARDRDGLCNAVVVSREDDEKGLIRFRESPEGTSWYHEVLEWDG